VEGSVNTATAKNLDVSGGEKMAIVEVSVVPLGTKTPSVSQYVARAVKILEREKDLKYETTAMGTIIEGDLDRILTAVKKMHEVIFGEGVARVITTIEIDDRRDKAQGMKEKIESLKKKL
jgi:uncharacterized protein (TIGR00106 family)